MAERSGILTRLREWLFPPRCCACGNLLDRAFLREALCPVCRREWESEREDICGFCAKPVKDCLCMPETMEKAKISAFYKLVYYRQGKGMPVQNRLIFRCKQQTRKRPLRFLAEELFSALEQPLSDPELCNPVLTYLPRRRSAELETGTDQARDLAFALSAISGYPVEKLIVRPFSVRQTAQKHLNPRERMRNARASFRLSSSASPDGKTVILVDDMVTTGAGMAVCARLLRKAGAERIICAAIASDDRNKEPLHASTSHLFCKKD